MLVLTRRHEQQVIIRHAGAEIVVTMLHERSTGGLKTRLGFEAPREVKIHRAEIQELIDAGVPQRT